MCYFCATWVRNRCYSTSSTCLNSSSAQKAPVPINTLFVVRSVSIKKKCPVCHVQDVWFGKNPTFKEWQHVTSEWNQLHSVTSSLEYLSIFFVLQLHNWWKLIFWLFNYSKDANGKVVDTGMRKQIQSVAILYLPQVIFFPGFVEMYQGVSELQQNLLCMFEKDTWTQCCCVAIWQTSRYVIHSTYTLSYCHCMVPCPLDDQGEQHEWCGAVCLAFAFFFPYAESMGKGSHVLMTYLEPLTCIC